MKNAPMAMSTLHGQMKLSEFGVGHIISIVKAHALLEQPVNNLSSLAHGESNGIFVTQARPSVERVSDMGFYRVPIMKNRGHTALCPEGGP